MVNAIAAKIKDVDSLPENSEKNVYKTFKQTKLFYVIKPRFILCTLDAFFRNDANYLYFLSLQQKHIVPVLIWTAL